MDLPPSHINSLGTTDQEVPPSNIVRLHDVPQIYSLAQAKALLPLIAKLTKIWHERADKILLAFHYAKDSKKRDQLEREFNDILDHWAEAIEKLGPTVKGPWLVDFDNGDGNYWCWQYPEEDILYKHSYHGGFQSRRPIAES